MCIASDGDWATMKKSALYNQNVQLIPAVFPT